MIFVAIAIFIIGYALGMTLGEISSYTKVDNYKKEIAKLQKENDEKKKETSELQDEVINLEQRVRYYADLYPIHSYCAEFVKDGKQYEITYPEKLYSDYNCTQEVKQLPEVNSVVVMDIILNEENHRYALRTDNTLIWAKEEPRIKEKE